MLEFAQWGDLQLFLLNQRSDDHHSIDNPSGNISSDNGLYRNSARCGDSIRIPADSHIATDDRKKKRDR
jgi:hypothetical protein